MSEAMDTFHHLGPSDTGSRGVKTSNFAVRRPRGFRGRGSRGKPSDRTTNWRHTVNAKVVAQEDADRNARFASIGMPRNQPSQPPNQSHSIAQPPSIPELSSVQFLGMAVTHYAKPLPIATQALGFIVNQYYLKLQEQLGADRVAERCSIHQLYRHSLAQLSYHLYRLRIEQAPRYSYRSRIPDPPIIGAAILESFKTLELNVGFITSYIQRIGVVTANDVPVVPVLMMDESPLYLNTFNLRNTLLAINGNDDRFNDFVARNSVPGLTISAGRIANIDVVMPRNYDSALIYRDASAVRALMNYTASKMRDVMMYTGRLGQTGDGSQAILLKSTSHPESQAEVRIPMTPNGIVVSVQGTVDDFWSDHKLTDDCIRLGILGLYVREDASSAFPTGDQWLNSDAASYMISADYSAYLNRLIG